MAHKLRVDTPNVCHVLPRSTSQLLRSRLASTSFDSLKPSTPCIRCPLLVREKSSHTSNNHVRFSQHDLKPHSHEFHLRLHSVPSGDVELPEAESPRYPEQYPSKKSIKSADSSPRLPKAQCSDVEFNTLAKRRQFMQRYQECVSNVRKDLSAMHKKVDRKLQLLAMGKIPKETVSKLCSQSASTSQRSQKFIDLKSAGHISRSSRIGN